MCPKPIKYEIDIVTQEDHQKRAVSFLVSNDPRVTAESAFKKLKKDQERTFRYRFNAWRDGLINKKWFHGWDPSEFGGKYSKCMVFKCKDGLVHHRLYGFLCNPRVYNPGFQLCVLVNYGQKEGWKTDESLLRTILEINMIDAVNKEIVQKGHVKYMT